MEEKILERKWFNYFSNMRKKYNMRVSCKKPLIIFLDAKDSSKNKRNLMPGSKDSFFECMTQTAKYLTKRFNCLSIWGCDEISFIIEDVETFIDAINNEKSYRTHDIVSIFSQYYFEYFNSIYDKETVYWHCKCFNIADEKLQSYIKYKSHVILKGITSQFLKQQGVKNAYGIKLDEKIEMCKKYESFNSIEDYKNGILCCNGDRININEYLNGKIKIYEEIQEDVQILDLTDF